MKHLPFDDGAVLGFQHGTAPIFQAAFVHQGQHALVLVQQLPLLQALPADARPQLQKQLAPGPRLIGQDKGLLLLDRSAELGLPVHVQAHKIGLRQRLVAALVVHDAPDHRGRDLAGLVDVHRRKVRVVGGLRLYGPALFRRLDGALRRLRHGRNKPFLPAAASLARA